ncbi:hypothetical protein N7499_013329 [Penicillium canescens]|uniref:Uncharacterized protein n=1 Tax=Penicillium canescens TaxID=5083 RepID=A0AAD6N5F1_PENCN|nr:uncharacterized protein N7446_000022 [Penicillium canescens]KAJ6011697.1 hypothetical protein N7522_002052 [Penicillium canescens]KAJ6030912.1 hypothetical protein N7460_011178 [Penicillium canescens]KAJ6059367.1 hypothetical protein N7444_003006 [Penicillium canescens]KAJ6064649.1 hypothetical protein N7499_013329 [Penicillium canescens]KAJ6077086.1 hypothetical protein N7446_000022 [Penicillium canescens]
MVPGRFVFPMLLSSRHVAETELIALAASVPMTETDPETRLGQGISSAVGPFSECLCAKLEDLRRK